MKDKLLALISALRALNENLDELEVPDKVFIRLAFESGIKEFETVVSIPFNGIQIVRGVESYRMVVWFK